MIKLNKFEAAKRHLNFSIRSYFEGQDLVPIMALIGSAHVITHELLQKIKPGSTWAHIHAEANDLPINEILNSLREITNWLKHANKEHLSEIEFGPEELNFLLFHTCLDLGELTPHEEKSIEVSVFQLWFVAKYPSIFEDKFNSEMLTSALELFPNLKNQSFANQLNVGLVVLNRELAICNKSLKHRTCGAGQFLSRSFMVLLRKIFHKTTA